MSEMPKNNPAFLAEVTTSSENLGTSRIKVRMPGEELAYLHTGSGEIVLVPKEQSNLLLNEARVLNDAVAQLQSANMAVQKLDEYVRQHYNDVMERQKAEQALEYALQWQEESYQKYYDIFGELEPLQEPAEGADSSAQGDTGQENKEKEDSLKLNGTAKKMTELVSLKGMSETERKKKREEDSKGKSEGGTYTKNLLQAQSVEHLKSIGRLPGKPSEKIIYVRRHKIQWPKMKVLENDGWRDVLTRKPGARGKSVDPKKLRHYLGRKAGELGSGWLKKQFEDDLKYEKSGTIDCSVFKVFDSWNEQLKVEKDISLDNQSIPLDINLSASAQLMRYSYGVSLDPDLEFSARKISVRAEGHAEVNAAKAEAKMTLYFPRKEGWIWHRTGKNGKQQDLMAVVCQVTVAASALVGASLAAELSIETSQKIVTESPPRLKGKPGPKGYKARRQNRIEIKKDTKLQPVGMNAGASVFAGARADAYAEGSLMWRDPEDQTMNDFASIASIKPGVSGMVGLAGGFKLAIEYVKGMFRVTAEASLCFGIGAEGVVTFSVNHLELLNFCRCVFYKILYANFENIQIFSKRAFSIFNSLKMLIALKGTATIAANYGKSEQEIEEIANNALAAASTQELIALANYESLKYALPEVKGALIYQLAQRGNEAKNFSMISSISQGIQQILETAMTKSELDNIVQHSTKDGGKGDAEVIKTALTKIFNLAAARSQISPSDELTPPDYSYASAERSLLQSGEFNTWFEALHAGLLSDFPRGFPAASPQSIEYQVLLAREGSDHPLYCSDGWSAFYDDKA